MKCSIFLIACMIAVLMQGCNSFAENSWELMGPGVTYHVLDFGTSNLYSHKLSDDGRLIYTPTIGLKKTFIDKDYMYHSLAAFHSENSIGSPVWGVMGGVGVHMFDFFNLGLAYGGYVQNNNDFANTGIKPYSLAGNTNAFVPLFGFEANFRFDTSDVMFLGFNNLVTPVITNHSLSLGWRY